MHAAAASRWTMSLVKLGAKRHIDRAGANQALPVQSFLNVRPLWAASSLAVLPSGEVFSQGNSFGFLSAGQTSDAVEDSALARRRDHLV